MFIASTPEVTFLITFLFEENVRSLSPGVNPIKEISY